MRFYTFICLLLLPFFTSAQQPQGNFENSGKIRFGFTLQGTPTYWKQNNLNHALKQQSLPATKDLQGSVAIGNIIQVEQLRFTLLMVAMLNSNSKDNHHLNQRFGNIELNSEYFITKNERISLSPLVGGGISYGRTWLRNNSSEENFSEALVSTNTTSLFNRQGYLNVAMNFGFNYSPRYRDHIYQLSLGYRFGFAEKKWSTDPRDQTLHDAPTDVLRQLYLAIKVNLFFARQM